MTAAVVEAPTAPWLPTLWTPSLTGTEDFPTAGDRLLQLLDEVWSIEEAETFRWDPWQRWLFRHVLEQYPPGHPRAGQLRWRQVVISLARQNGKTLLQAGLALWGLTQHTRAPRVIGIAAGVDQANIAYGYVRHVVTQHPALRRRFVGTGTRGIRSRSESRPASYVVKAGTEKALQGPPASLVIFDELHIARDTAWSAVVLGTSARPNAMVIGVTTAGDDNSELLKRLYRAGTDAALRRDGYDERFGFFLWEAPSGAAVDDPEALRAANPAIACGRLDVADAQRDVRSMPEPQARRYRLNQFIASENAALPLSRWAALPHGQVDRDAGEVVFAVARAENWAFASIVAAARSADGTVTCELVASITNPSIDTLERLCLQLAAGNRCRFVVPAETLKDLSDRLRAQGLISEYLTLAQQANASATAHALISEGRVAHTGDPLIATQMPKAVAVNVAEGWRISATKSTGDVDAVIATILALWGAETLEPQGPAIVVG